MRVILGDNDAIDEKYVRFARFWKEHEFIIDKNKRN